MFNSEQFFAYLLAHNTKLLLYYIFLHIRHCNMQTVMKNGGNRKFSCKWKQECNCSFLLPTREWWLPKHWKTRLLVRKTQNWLHVFKKKKQTPQTKAKSSHSLACALCPMLLGGQSHGPTHHCLSPSFCICWDRYHKDAAMYWSSALPVDLSRTHTEISHN